MPSIALRGDYTAEPVRGIAARARDADPDAMPFLDHLEELRRRILWILAALLIGFVVGLWVVTHFEVLQLLISPIEPLLGETKLKYLSPTDPFFVTLKLAAVVGLLVVPNVVIVNRSVEWWRSLHQKSTLVQLDPTIEGDMLVALMVGFVAIGLVFTWLMIHRFRVAWLEQQADRVDLDAALAERRAEASAGGAPAETPVTGAASSTAPSGPSASSPEVSP